MTKLVNRFASASAAAATVAAIISIVTSPTARADESVVYEVVSDFISTANVEYYDHSKRIALQQVPLPWRITATVPSAVSPTEDGAQIRADWRPLRGRYKWVTVRILSGGKVLCESTLYIGDATCYGSTPHTSYPQTGGG